MAATGTLRQRAVSVCAGLVLAVAARGQDTLPTPRPAPTVQDVVPAPQSAVPPPLPETDAQVYPIDLPTALRLVNADNPTVAAAQAAVLAAYQRQRQAQVLWLPNLLLTPASYGRHDGQTQFEGTGQVVTASYGNLANNGSAVLNFGLAEAYYAPLITRQLTAAQFQQARAVNQNLQQDVAVAYLNLLRAHARIAVNAEALSNALEMEKNAAAAALAGKSQTAADLQRARTEVARLRVQRIDLEAQAAVASAHLVQLVYLPPALDLRPADAQVLPVTLVPVESVLDELLLVAFANRPELLQSRDQAAAALERWRLARTRPWLPQVQVGYTAGAFGGGPNATITNYGGRGDGQAQLVWQFTNLGLADVARAREQRALYNQAGYEVLQVQAQVAAEVTAALRVARARLRTLQTAQDGVRQAVEMWRRLRESAFGLASAAQRYDPLEPLLAEQALQQAREQYLNEVVEYNQTQFRLYTALGQPAVEALPKAVALPLDVTVVPHFPGQVQPDQQPPAPPR